MKTLIIWNPAASRVSPQSLARVLGELAAVSNIGTYRTRAAGDGANYIKDQIEQFDAVVTLGGDGTAREVLEAIAGRVPVGILPGGGTNVFARALGLPRSIPGAARQLAEAISLQRERTVHLGLANGDIFMFACGLGIDAEVVRAVDGKERSVDTEGFAGVRRATEAAFIMAAAERILGKYQPPTLTVEAPGVSMQGSAVLVGSADPWSFLGLMSLHLNPHRKGERRHGLDVLVIERLDLLTLGPLLIAAAGLAPLARRLPAGVVLLEGIEEGVIYADRPTAYQLDGDDQGDTEALYLGVSPSGSRILV